MTVFDQFQQTAKQYQDALAIVDQNTQLTYGELLERVAAFRDWLRKTLHPRQGCVVAVSLRNSWQFIASLFAASSLELAFFPCNTQWRASELRWFARRLDIAGALVEQEFRPAWDEISDLLPPQSVLAIPDAFDDCHHDPDSRPSLDSDASTAIFLATSGSTGVPRLVPRNHRNLIAGSVNVARTLGIGPGGRILGVVPFHHSNGFHNCMLTPLLAGAAVILMRRFSPLSCAELIRREGVNVIIGSPPIYRFLLESAVDPSLLSSVQHCFSAGARLPRELAKKWTAHFVTRLRQWYGMAEAHAISIDFGKDEPESRAGAFIGSPVSGVEVSILDEAGNRLRFGDVGEIAVRSEAVFSGYWQEPSKGLYCDGFFRTGDLGYLDSDRNLYLMGRMRRIINIGGVKVDPVEVEKTIETLPEVSECHVDTVGNGNGSEFIRARIALHAGAQVDRRDVIEWCRARLAEYKLPRVIEFLDRLPKTMAGKMPVQWRTRDQV